jgi:hypothetical protein
MSIKALESLRILVGNQDARSKLMSSKHHNTKLDSRFGFCKNDLKLKKTVFYLLETICHCFSRERPNWIGRVNPSSSTYLTAILETTATHPRTIQRRLKLFEG